MEVTNQPFTIRDIFQLKERIDPKPQYQRTPVWKIDRKKLLLDSIFRGYDLPKFYLNTLSNNAFFNFEVCDGQQRLRTIWEFMEDKITVGSDISISGESIANKKYSQLTHDAKGYFDSFILTIGTIQNAKQSEIRELFARLQKGVGLNQAELRRALSTQIGVYVESIVDNHLFFKNCGIAESRNKYQDYIDHVIAYLVNDFKNDFKGQNLRDTYINISPNQAVQLIREVSVILDDMEKINQFHKGIFRNKWAFVDVFIIINQYRKDNKKVIYKEFTTSFMRFEALRKQYYGNPRLLIEKHNPTPEDRRLYDYLICFAKDGALKANMRKRHDVFMFQFKESFK